MGILKGQNYIKYAEHFKTDKNRNEYLSELKWKNGFSYREYSHEVIPIRTAFFICFEMFKSFSTLKIIVCYDFKKLVCA